MPANEASPALKPKEVLDRIASFKFDQFHPDKDVWKYYLQRFTLEINLLQLNGTEYDDSRRDLLLRAIGTPTYQVASEHFEPRELTKVSYSELTSFLTQHYTKSVSYVVARCRFGQCMRQEQASVSDFVATLRSLAPDCRFGSSLDERLRDQLFIGLKNPSMLERLSELHSEPTDRFDAVLKSALSFEAAQQQRVALSAFDSTTTNSASANQIHQVQSKPKKPKYKPKHNANNNNNGTNNSANSQAGKNNANNNRSFNNNRTAPRNSYVTNSGGNMRSLNPSEHCLRCGGRRHAVTSDCKAVNATCRACQKIGHYDRRACVSTGRATILKKIHSVSLQANSDAQNSPIPGNTDYRHFYNVVSSSPEGHYYITPIVNQHPLQMEYDTAADFSVIGSHTWKQLGSPELCPLRVV